MHRPRYDDWSLPVGRVEHGETLEACALREVAEETGHRCRIVAFVETLTIDADDGVHRFHIFEMEPVGVGTFVPNPETDAVAWLSVDDAAGRATYPNIRSLLTALRARSEFS